MVSNAKCLSIERSPPTGECQRSPGRNGFKTKLLLKKIEFLINFNISATQFVAPSIASIIQIIVEDRVEGKQWLWNIRSWTGLKQNREDFARSINNTIYIMIGFILKC